MKDAIKIVCPHCKNSFDVEEALSHQLEAQYKKQFEKKEQELSQQVAEEHEKMKEEREKLAQEKKEQDKYVHAQVEGKLKEARNKITEEEAQKTQEKIKLLEEESAKRKQETIALQQKEIEWIKNKHELERKQETQKIEMKKELFRQQKEIENKAKMSLEKKHASELEESKLREAELQKKLADSIKSAEELKKKAEQGSAQLQGEVQELALEEILAHAFPFDSIKEIPKGTQGADCIQKVINAHRQECGSIVYESKRTKKYSSEWTSKLKQDQMSCNADIAILVTQAMPTDMNEFGEREGVWICRFHEVKALSTVLRDSLVRIHAVAQTQVNKGEKMELLYNYLTSSRFVNTVKHIVENYQQMTEQLNREKRVMQTHWATRAKQLETVQESFSLFFGSVKGIVGKSLDSTGVLELESPPPELDM